MQQVQDDAVCREALLGLLYVRIAIGRNSCCTCAQVTVCRARIEASCTQNNRSPLHGSFGLSDSSVVNESLSQRCYQVQSIPPEPWTHSRRCEERPGRGPSKRSSYSHQA